MLKHYKRSLKSVFKMFRGDSGGLAVMQLNSHEKIPGSSPETTLLGMYAPCPKSLPVSLMEEINKL